jgi:hypothetical protein
MFGSGIILALVKELVNDFEAIVLERKCYL